MAMAEFVHESRLLNVAHITRAQRHRMLWAAGVAGSLCDYCLDDGLIER